MACGECAIMRMLVFLKNVKSSVLKVNISTCFGNDFKQTASTASSEWNHWAVNLPTATEEASASQQGMGGIHTLFDAFIHSPKSTVSLKLDPFGHSTNIFEK